jgi:hypothetical protein
VFICDIHAKYALWKKCPASKLPYKRTMYRIVEKILNDRLSAGQNKM